MLLTETIWIASGISLTSQEEILLSGCEYPLDQSTNNNQTIQIMNKLEKSISMIAGVLLLLSCSHDEKVVAPTISNEALTTVQLQLVNTANANDKPTAQWEQLLDNNGNPLPVDVSKANLTLKANATYQVSIILFDKTQNPVF